MPQCLLVHDKSLRFSKVVYGIFAFVAFLFTNPWLVLATSILMFVASVSIRYNFPYWFHYLFLRTVPGNKSGSIKKGTEELSFTFGLGGIFLLAAFLLIIFGKFAVFAWILTLVMSLLMLMGGLTDFCAASMLYALYIYFLKALRI
jgi:hypothetical protein